MLTQKKKRVCVAATDSSHIEMLQRRSEISSSLRVECPITTIQYRFNCMQTYISTEQKKTTVQSKPYHRVSEHKLINFSQQMCALRCHAKNHFIKINSIIIIAIGGAVIDTHYYDNNSCIYTMLIFSLALKMLRITFNSIG